MSRLGREWIDSSISYGSLKVEDVVPKLVRFIRMAGDRQTRSNLEVLLGSYGYEAAGWDWESDDAVYLYSDLEDMLDEMAPEGSYFGALPGDGADIGFWSTEGLDLEQEESNEQPD